MAPVGIPIAMVERTAVTLVVSLKYYFINIKPKCSFLSSILQRRQKKILSENNLRCVHGLHVLFKSIHYH